PWLLEDIWVLDGQFILDGVKVRPPEAFDHVQRFGMPIPLKFGLLVETDRVHDQRVSFPASNGVTQPARIGIHRMRASIRRYDSERSRIFVEYRDVIRALKNLELIRHTPRLWRNQWHAVGCRSGILRPSHNSVFFRAGLQHGSSWSRAASTTSA